MDLFEKCISFNKFKNEEQLINNYKNEHLEDFNKINNNLIKNESYELKNNWQWLSLRYERRLNEILNLIKNKKKNSVIDNNNLININNENINYINPKVFSSFLPNVLSNYIHSLLTNNKCNIQLEEEKEDVENKVKITLLNNNNILSNVYNINDTIQVNDTREEVSDYIIMFCDISGFTHITELIEKNNNSTHVARLGQFLRDFFYPLVDLVHHFGGDIVQFSGDALLCIFYINSPNCINNNEPNINIKDNYEYNNKEDVKVFINCLKCCEELHSTLNNYPFLINEEFEDELNNGYKNEERLELHISCVFGKAAMRVVGGLFDRFECYVDGSALKELSELSVMAVPSCTMVCDSFRKVVGKFANFKVVSNNSYGKLYYEFVSFNEHLVEELMSDNEQIEVVTRNDKEIEGEQINYKLYIKILSYFIPRYIYNKLLNNVYLYNNEIRSITVIFINFQINCNNENILKSNMIKELMYICQKSIYSFEGTLNKLIVDDKGLSILVFMGFPPFFTENACFNSILCGLNIYHNVNKLYNNYHMNKSNNCYPNLNNNDELINVGIGISTGNVWCGILGNKDRREYTSIGDVVNLSNRLMSYSLKLTQINKNYNEHNVMTKCTMKDNVMSKCTMKDNEVDYYDNLKIIRDNNIKYKIIIDSKTFEECKNLIELIPLNPINIKNKPNKYDIYTTTGQLLNHSYYLNKSSSYSSVNSIVNNKDIDNKDIDGEYKWNMNILRMLYGDSIKIEEIMGSKVVYFKCNDDNDNELLYNFLMSEIEENCTDCKILNIDYTKTVLRDFEGIHREVYYELVREIINLWFNSSNRLNFYYNIHNECREDYINKYLNIGDKNNKLILKELLDPKYHWYLNILLGEQDTNTLYDIIELNSKSKRSSNVLNELFLPTSFGSSRNDYSDKCESIKPDKSKLVGDILMFYENERRHLDDYLFSLIQSLNRYEDLLLLINLKDECPPLVNKLLEYSKNSCNKLILLIINNDHDTIEDLNLLSLENFTKRVDSIDNQQLTRLNLYNLNKEQIKQIIHNITLDNDDNDDDDDNKLVDNDNNDKLVNNNNKLVDNNNKLVDNNNKLEDIIFNNTNGVYCFVYLYIEHVINSLNKVNVNDLERLFEKKIMNYFKYKIDKLELNELFILKVLTLLNQRITIDKLKEIIKLGDLKSERNVYNNININQILLKLLNYNLITNCVNCSDDDQVMFIVNNNILKRLIKDMIIIEEKLQIINNYIINF